MRRQTNKQHILIKFLRQTRYTSTNRSEEPLEIPEGTNLVGEYLGTARSRPGRIALINGYELTISPDTAQTILVERPPIPTLQSLRDASLQTAQSKASSGIWLDAMHAYDQAICQMRLLDDPESEIQRVRTLSIRARNEHYRTQPAERYQRNWDHITTADAAEIGWAVLELFVAVGGFPYTVPTAEEGDIIWNILGAIIQDTTLAASLRPEFERILARRRAEQADRSVEVREDVRNTNDALPEQRWPRDPEVRRSTLQRLAGPLTVGDFPLSPHVRETQARFALLLDSDDPDAYLILADLARNQGNLKEARRLTERAIAAGERSLGSRLEDYQDEVFWGDTDTRPYMRALHHSGLYAWQDGDLTMAAERFKRMLQLNPNDNQGARYLLASLLLELGDDAEFEVLQQELWQSYTRTKHDDDDDDNWDDEDEMEDCNQDESLGLEASGRASDHALRLPVGAALDLDVPGYSEGADWKWPVALHRFRVEGNSKNSRAALQRAIEVNALVPAFLLSEQTLPAGYEPQSYSSGSIEEAMNYAQYGLPSWERTPGALTWLMQYTPTSTRWSGNGHGHTSSSPKALPAKDASLLKLVDAWHHDGASSGYHSAAKQFCMWLTELGRPAQTAQSLTKEIVLLYQDHLSQRKYADSTIKVKRTALRAWLIWLHRHEYIAEDLSIHA